MYIPPINAFYNTEEIVAFMQRFSFATIITSVNDKPLATHLPFVVTVMEDKIILSAHFAKSNLHWQDIENHTSLVIFSEPHAYISPANYSKETNVPTWNYIAVHAYGKGRIIAEPHAVMRMIEAAIENYEAGYQLQWNELPVEFKMKMLNGIVGFELEVTELQAKKKLSQNRTEAEQEKIIDTLAKSDATNERLIADYMKSN